MELKPSTVNLPPFQVQEPDVAHWYAEQPNSKRASKMIKLIRHLEQNVEGPQQWVTLSATRGCFYITETDTWEFPAARVEMYDHREGYEIRYRVPDEHSPWPDDVFNWWGTWIVGLAPNVEVAGRMVAIALKRAATDLPQSRPEAKERYGFSH